MSSIKIKTSATVWRKDQRLKPLASELIRYTGAVAAVIVAAANAGGVSVFLRLFYFLHISIRSEWSHKPRLLLVLLWLLHISFFVVITAYTYGIRIDLFVCCCVCVDEFSSIIFTFEKNRFELECSSLCRFVLFNLLSCSEFFWIYLLIGFGNEARARANIFVSDSRASPNINIFPWQMREKK